MSKAVALWRPKDETSLRSGRTPLMGKKKHARAAGSEEASDTLAHVKALMAEPRKARSTRR